MARGLKRSASRKGPHPTLQPVPMLEPVSRVAAGLHEVRGVLAVDKVLQDVPGPLAIHLRAGPLSRCVQLALAGPEASPAWPYLPEEKEMARGV